MKGKNKVIVNPSIGESIRAELTGITQKKIEEANAASMERAADKVEKEQKELANAKIKREMMKKKVVSSGMAVEGMDGPCAEPEEKSKKEEGQEDPRGMKTKINLAKNKLRAMGLKMSYDMEGDLVDEDMKPLPKERMERQSDRAYAKEVVAAHHGKSKEANKQMQRRIAMKDPQGRKEVLRKKNNKVVNEEGAETETLLTFGQFDELYKGKHGQTEKQYQDSRSDAGKMVSGDSKGSGANYSYRAKNTGSNPAGGSKKPQGQARMGSKDRAYLKMQKANLKAKNEEFVNEEGADSLKDRQLERGGMGARRTPNKPIGAPNTFGKKPGQKYDGMSAVEKVKASIEKRYGKGAIIDTKKK
jgi:hypothetical protein